MSKNVLIISSSPRANGNSAFLCRQLADGAIGSGNNVEVISLTEKQINYCTGCGMCFEGKNLCPQKDDMAVILQKMINADVIVMATPVYFYAMCGQMKTFIDRTCARYREINNKEFYFIVTAADSSHAAMQRTIEEFRGFTDCLDNPQERGVIYGTGAWKVGEINCMSISQEAYAIGAGM